MINKILMQIKSKKGASLIDLMLIVGALALITSFGLQMFKKQANSSGQAFQQNVAQAEANILK